jgi:hypothetical protein
MDETIHSATDIIDSIHPDFIPVRVDANTRPDIDNLYNQGGRLAQHCGLHARGRNSAGRFMYQPTRFWQQ